MENKQTKNFKEIINTPINLLENILEKSIDFKKTRRTWLFCFIVSSVMIVLLISWYFARTFDREYLIAFISLTSGLVTAFLIAWINEASKEKQTKERRAKLRKYYVAKYKLAKNKEQQKRILEKIEERNLFEDIPVFTQEELTELCNQTTCSDNTSN